MIAAGTYSVQDIQTVAEAHFAQVGKERGKGYKPYKRWEYQALRRMDENGMLKSPEFYVKELENYNSYLNNNSLLARTTVGSWEPLGPTTKNQTSGWNPGVGRITSFAAASDNPNHIIVGANTGGVWKSLDKGLTWNVLTDNLSNLSVYALAIDPTNANNYYWGSTGGVIFKSEDAGATWNLLADTGNGNVNKIVIDPSNTNKMYCTAEYGGIFKSSDAGLTWALINNTATNGYDVELKPGDPNTVYASGEAFYMSTNAGETFQSPDGLNLWSQNYISGTNDWTTTASNQDNSVTPRTGAAMAYFNVENYSMPTTQLVTPTLDLSEIENPQLKFSFTNVNWAGDIDALKILYKTSETGTWVELANYTTESSAWNDININLPNPNSTYNIAFEGTANYGRGITLDDIEVGNTTGTIIFEDGFESAPNSFGSGPKMIAVSESNPETLYVLEAANGIFGGLHKSVDGGTSFTKLDHTGKNYFGYSSNPEDPDDALFGQAPRDMDIAVNPNNSNDVHIAGINTWRSIDGGASFTITSQWTPQGAVEQNVGYCHADIDMLQFVEDQLYVMSDGGIFIAETPTIVNASYYSDLTAGLGIRQFYKIGVSQTNPVIVAGGAQDNGSSVMGADGMWSDWLGADGMESFIDKTLSSTLYGTTQYGELYKSLDNGSNYFYLGTPEGKSGNWVTPFEQDPIQVNTIYTGYDQVYKSIDGGTNWMPVSQIFGGNLDHLKIAATNGNFQYAARGAKLYKNTAVGTTTPWTELNGFSGNINSIAIHPTDPNKVAIATTNNQKVFVSLDGGSSWTPYKLNLPNFSAQALVWQDNDKDGLYLGMNYGVFYIDNTLTEWQPFSNGLPNVMISELEINYATNKIYVGTYGRGLWASNLYDETLSISEFKLKDLSVYPNPASNSINLKWDQDDSVSIRIYDTQGKVMFYDKNDHIQKGLKIDVSGYASGLYFVKVNNTKGEVTKKIMVN